MSIENLTKEQIESEISLKKMQIASDMFYIKTLEEQLETIAKETKG